MAIGYAETYYPPGVQPQWTGALQQSDDGGNINRYAFEYTPVSKEVQQKQLEEFKRATAPGGTGDVEFNMQEAVKQLGLERAEQAMTMAMRYQGQRMYNQALKNGEDPATALAKAAPMMFYSKTGGNAGEMINALRPRVAPQMTPYQQARLELDRLKANRPEKPPQNWEWIPAAGNQPGHFRDKVTGQIRLAAAPPGSSVLSPKDALNFELSRNRGMIQAANAAVSAADPNSIGYNTATNAIANLKGLSIPDSVKPIPTVTATVSQAPIAQPSPSVPNAFDEGDEEAADQGPVEVKTKAEFDALPRGSLYLNKGKTYRKP